MIPVVFTHTSNAIYLQTALLQAKKLCGDNIYLLGDKSNSKSPVHHAYISDLENSELFTEFKSVFKNLSPNGYDYELFCFKRWFLILEFCRRNNFEEVFCVDSDVLIYKDLNELKEMLQNVDFTVIRFIGKFAGPQCSYFKISALERYCNFILNFYKNRFSELEALYKKFQEEKNVSGISDMVLLALFCEENKGKYIDFDYDMNINESNSKKRTFCFDENISCSAGFKLKDGMKNITFIDNVPYCTREDTDKEVPFYILHFQGAAKKLMEKYSTITKSEIKSSPYMQTLKMKERFNCIKKFIKRILHK